MYTKTNGGDLHFYFMLCQSSLLTTVISFVYNVSYVLFGKYLKKNYFIPSPHEFFIELNLKTFFMQLKRQVVEAWQNEKHCSKGNDISENPTPRKEIFKPVDHVKYEGQVRSQHLLFVQFSC